VEDVSRARQRWDEASLMRHILERFEGRQLGSDLGIEAVAVKRADTRRASFGTIDRRTVGVRASVCAVWQQSCEPLSEQERKEENWEESTHGPSITSGPDEGSCNRFRVPRCRPAGDPVIRSQLPKSSRLFPYLPQEALRPRRFELLRRFALYSADCTYGLGR
jgi:hypothetical protein